MSEGTPSRDEAIEAAAARLAEAAASGTACAPVRDLLGGYGIAEAYAVAQRNVDRALAAGSRVAGWKAGLTSLAVQQQLKVDSPDFGTLLDTCYYGDAEPVPLSRLMQPRIEAEVAFVIGSDLPARRVTGADVLRATEFVLPALEIVDSRIAGWDITLLDTVADNASSGLYVLGLSPVRATSVDVRGVAMRMSRREGCAGGAEGGASSGAGGRAGGAGGAGAGAAAPSEEEVVSVGSGSACLGHPVNAVVWLANTLLGLGRPLRAGEVVLSGALGPMVPITGPMRFEAVIDGLGSVRAEIAAG